MWQDGKLMGLLSDLKEGKKIGSSKCKQVEEEKREENINNKSHNKHSHQKN